MKNIILLFLLISSFILSSCTPKAKTVNPDEARQIAKEAYIYGFPLVMNYKTLYVYTLEAKSPEYKGDFNQMACDARLYTPEDKTVVTPNSDTPYCMLWCDIRKEPVVITVPDIEAGRYYSFQLIDLYTHNFAYIGSLTTGNKAGSYLVTPVGWKGILPEGITDVITCETDLFFTVVRTQLKGAEDIDNVRKIQGEYHVQTLSNFTKQDAESETAILDFPNWIEGDQFTPAAFIYLNYMLQFIHPVENEKALIHSFSKLGIGTEAGFDTTAFDTEILTAINEGVMEGMTQIKDFIRQNNGDPLMSSKMFGTRSFLSKSAAEYNTLKNFYLLRAVGAQMGLYGNSGFEALYPTYLTDAEGNTLDGLKNKYTLTFNKGNLPPVKSFWSITMYDGKTQLLIKNPIDRYLVNSSMMNEFVSDDNGELTIYVQKDSPGKKLEANWLPAPDGPFYCVMRLYGPEDVALSGEWVKPQLVRTK